MSHVIQDYSSMHSQAEALLEQLSLVCTLKSFWSKANVRARGHNSIALGMHVFILPRAVAEFLPQQGVVQQLYTMEVDFLGLLLRMGVFMLILTCGVTSTLLTSECEHSVWGIQLL